jgi:hypothetical protein
MILTDSHINLAIEKFNPTITLRDCSSKKEYSFPDLNSYYILSDAGKNFKIMENSTVLLSFQKGYFESFFFMSDYSNLILNLSNQLFAGSEPIEGIAKDALDLAILKSGKSNPTLKNRL